jgi:hypothetical protein
VGKIFHYQQETAEGTETNTVEITNGTKVVMGVTTTVCAIGCSSMAS